MTGPSRIVMVDDDADVLELARRALPPPEFELHAFTDARDALMRLHDLRPHLIVCDVVMPAMDGRSFFAVVKRSEALRSVPFIYLSAQQSNEEVMAALEAGADDYLIKPFPLVRLVAKIRATLRLAERLTSAEPRQYALSGQVGPTGTIPLLKFCEDFKLTGRLSVEAGGRTLWAEFQGGDLARGGAEPEAPGEDPLDALLAVREGAYRIEQSPMDPAALKELEARAGVTRPAPPAPTGPPPLPGGRLSVVEVGGESLQVQTEGENRPDFTVVTLVARGGQVVRRIESAWSHPLQRREDLPLAQSQVEEQHERVAAGLKDMVLERAPRQSPAAPEERGVETSLLAWALSFIAEQAIAHLGSASTVALLKRTRKRLALQKPALLHFRVSENGRIAPETPGPSHLPREAVTTVAEWAVAFLAEAGAAVPQVKAIRVRAVTRMIAADLEKAGFYAAFEALNPNRPA